MQLNKAVMDIVIFVLFGLCSAVSGEEESKTDNVLSEQINVGQNVESELLKSSFQIKTYQDIVDRTLFQTSTVDIDAQNPEQLQNQFDDKMKNVEKTYKKYAYMHLNSLNFIFNKTVSSEFGFLMPIVFKDNAIRVFSKCKLSLKNIGYELPEWMEKYLAFLNDIEFQEDENGHIQFAVTPEFVEKIEQIEKLLIEVTDDFPKTRHLTPLTEGKGNIHVLTQHLPWVGFNVLIVSFNGVYDELRCSTDVDKLIELSPGVFDECETISYFHLVVHDLMQLQIILDVNRELLRYDDGSTGVGSGRGKFEVRQTENNSGSKLMDSFSKIKTYEDVFQGTMFQTSTENDTYDVTPDEPDSKLVDKIKNVDRTYAIYAYRHFENLVYILNKHVPAGHYGPMTINLRTNALEVLSKCKFTFIANGLPLPEWLKKYIALLNAIEFRVIDGILKIFITGPLFKAIVEINALFAELLEGFPIGKGFVLLNEGDGKTNFMKQVLPWKILHFFCDLYGGVYKRYGCKTKMNSSKADRTTLIKCASTNYYYRVVYNLMELQIILDANKEVLPYYD